MSFSGQNFAEAVFVNTSRVWTADSRVEVESEPDKGAIVAFVGAVPLGTNPSDSEIAQEAGDPVGASGVAWRGNRQTKKDDYGAAYQR